MCFLFLPRQHCQTKKKKSAVLPLLQIQSKIRWGLNILSECLPLANISPHVHKLRGRGGAGNCISQLRQKVGFTS